MSQKIDLAAILARRLEDFKTEAEAAAHFKVSANQVAKFRSTLNFPTVGWQKLIDELQRDNRLWLLEAPGRPPTPAKEPAPATSAPMVAQTEENPQGGALALMAATPSDPSELAAAAIAAMPDMNREDRIAIVSTAIAENKRDVEILIPASETRDIPPKLFISVLGNTLNLRTARVSVEQEDTVEDSKNTLIHRMLHAGSQWALLLATDIMAPFGNPEWMKHYAGSPFAPEFTGLRTLDRLTATDTRKIVGGLYSAANGKLAIAQEFGDQTDEGKAALSLILEKGPQNNLIEVPWVASGLVAVHRQVFLDIIASNKELANQTQGSPFPFFAPMAGKFGGDKRFCALARKAGHKVYLDLAVYGARIVRTIHYPRA